METSREMIDGRYYSAGTHQIYGFPEVRPDFPLPEGSHPVKNSRFREAPSEFQEMIGSNHLDNSQRRWFISSKGIATLSEAFHQSSSDGSCRISRLSAPPNPVEIFQLGRDLRVLPSFFF